MIPAKCAVISFHRAWIIRPETDVYLMKNIRRSIPVFFLFGIISVQAQTGEPLFKTTDSGWTFHFQFTGILDYHPANKEPYEGRNSFKSEYEKTYSVTSTAFIGRRLWHGAALYFNPEMAGGEGPSSTLGIAGFPNGETFRIGDPRTLVYVARLYLRQQINIDKEHMVTLDEGQNQVRETVSAKRLTINAGKFGIADFVDQNSVSHDPRSDFMNWALMNNGAFDYPANTRGYTAGIALEYYTPGWVLRLATALVPDYANGPYFDRKYPKAGGNSFEIQKNYQWHDHPGSARLLLFYNASKAPAYRDVIDKYENGTDRSLDVIHGDKYGGKKFGVGFNADQELNDRLHAFLRAGWNDGKTASWAFAEIDNTLSGGVRYYGIGKGRSADNIGLAILTNGISKGHKDFLAVGGYGFMIGDGKLPNYSREDIAELFYQVKLFQYIFGTLDYQFVVNPAYNADRGPIHLFAARVHVYF